MKFALPITLAGFVAAVSAQNNYGGLSECVVNCAFTALKNIDCDLTDYKCICSNQSFLTSVGICVVGTCPEADQQAAYASAESMCQSAGATLYIPSSEPASSTVTSSAVTSSAAASSTVYTTVATPAPSSPTGEYSTPVSTESFPSVISNYTIATSTVSTSATAILPSDNVTATGSTPPMQSTNAAAGLSGMGGIVALGLGLVAAFAI